MANDDVVDRVDDDVKMTCQPGDAQTHIRHLHQVSNILVGPNKQSESIKRMLPHILCIHSGKFGLSHFSLSFILHAR